MDLIKIIGELRGELEKIDQLIASMEQFQSAGVLPEIRRRGRKSMPEEERRLVSERMTKYWDAQRRRKGA